MFITFYKNRREKKKKRYKMQTEYKVLMILKVNFRVSQFRTDSPSSKCEMMHLSLQTLWPLSTGFTK